MLSLKALGEGSFLPSPASICCWQSVVFLGLQLSPSNSCLCLHTASLHVCISGVQISSSSKDVSHMEFEVHPKPLRPHLNLVLFPNRSHSQAPKTRKLTYIGGGEGATIQATTTAFTRGKEVPSLFLIIKLIHVHYHCREHFKSTKEKKIHL